MEEKIIIRSEIQISKRIFIPFYIILLLFLYALLSNMTARTNESTFRSAILIITIIATVVIGKFVEKFVSWYIYRISLTVTDKRVFGCTLFGKRVDLPLDSIAAIGTGRFNRIAVTTASGSINFLFIKNFREIHEVLSELLISRQQIKQAAVPSSNTAQELRQYKQLLDEGIITQEEFEQKKKQYLGL